MAIAAPELMFASRIEGGLRAAGHELVGADDDPDLVIADVELLDPATIPGRVRLGFYPHTQVALRRRAEAAGFDLVVPRSRIARELPALIDRLLS